MKFRSEYCRLSFFTQIFAPVECHGTVGVLNAVKTEIFSSNFSKSDRGRNLSWVEGNHLNEFVVVNRRRASHLDAFYHACFTHKQGITISKGGYFCIKAHLPLKK